MAEPNDAARHEYYDLLDLLIHRRKNYPQRIEKIHKKILEMEVALLKKEMPTGPCKKKNEDFEMATFKTDEKTEKEHTERWNRLHNRYKDLLEKADNVRKIRKQIKDDDIHKILRERVDSETLLKRAERAKMVQ